MFEGKEIPFVARIIFGLIVVATATHGETTGVVDAKSCCPPGSSPGAPVTVTTAESGSVNSNSAKSRNAGTSNLSTRGWPAKPWPEGMVWIPGGEFFMGTTVNGHGNSEMPMESNDAEPVHRVLIDGFWMDATTVTNEQFEKFVRATGYVTVAERPPLKEEFSSGPPEKPVAGSAVFSATGREVSLENHLQWWTYVKDANWRHPLGPKSDLKRREKYPVVQVAYADAEAYAKWAGKSLPTEAEFEFAARGGLVGKTYVWGDEFRPGGKWMANTWQGKFPVKDTGEDGYAGIAPVKSFPPNGYGLYDMSGNVWQWCSDWYRADYYKTLAEKGGVARNPRGPDTSFDPSEPGVKERVQRGGSFLCNDQYCSRYIVGSRGKGDVETATNHLGFRTVMTPTIWAERQKMNKPLP